MADNKYQRGKIYRIISDQSDQVYIGSTIEKTLACRLSKHRDMHKRYLAGIHNRVTSFDILQYPDAQIILVENYPCQNKDELLARERHWIENTPNCVNKIIPGRTNAEYYQDNKDELLTRAREYYLANAQRKNQQYVCSCGGKYTAIHKTLHEKTQRHQKYIEAQAKNDNELLNNFIQELGL